MGKRGHRRSASQDEDNVGCVWGLMRMVYFRRDPKFLLDTKQLSERHAFQDISGKFSSLKTVTVAFFLLVDQGYQCGHSYLSSTSSLQKMFSNFRCFNPITFTSFSCYYYVFVSICLLLLVWLFQQILMTIYLQVKSAQVAAWIRFINCFSLSYVLKLNKA